MGKGLNNKAPVLAQNKLTILLICMQLSVGCSSKSESQREEIIPGDSLNKKASTDSSIFPNFKNFGITTDTLGSYSKTLEFIDVERLRLESSFEENAITIDSVGNAFCELLVNHIIPYWYGTTWSFDGHTNVPNQGQTACGYFVSTTLKHIGLKLDRYKMAQQPALNAMKSITRSSSIVILGNSTPSKMASHLKNNSEEGIYLVGLDCHVGFILYKENEVFFIHSSYLNPYAVTIELAETSKVLALSKSFYLAPISKNETLMLKWLNHQHIEIVTK